MSWEEEGVAVVENLTQIMQKDSDQAFRRMQYLLMGEGHFPSQFHLNGHKY